jgi:hypothetical protein
MPRFPPPLALLALALSASSSAILVRQAADGELAPTAAPEFGNPAPGAFIPGGGGSEVPPASIGTGGPAVGGGGGGGNRGPPDLAAFLATRRLYKCSQFVLCDACTRLPADIAAAMDARAAFPGDVYAAPVAGSPPPRPADCGGAGSAPFTFNLAKAGQEACAKILAQNIPCCVAGTSPDGKPILAPSCPVEGGSGDVGGGASGGASASAGADGSVADESDAPQVPSGGRPRKTLTDPEVTPAVAAGGGGGGSDSACFPADATVELEDGSLVRMDAVAIGDVVKVGAGGFSRVFMFTHRMAHSANTFVSLETASGASLSLTKGHYIFADGALVAASEVAVGSELTLGNGEVSAVVAVGSTNGEGLFNPQTVDGNIVVNGVLASTYTTAVEPSLAHAILAPFRLFTNFGLQFTALESGGGALDAVAPRGPAVG